MLDVILILIGLAVGVAVGYLFANSRFFRQFQEEREARVAAETRLAEIEKQLEAQKSLVDEATSKLGDTFKALSSDALRNNAQAFVDSAKQTLEPLEKSLKALDDQVRDVERSRREDYGGLTAQVKGLLASEKEILDTGRSLERETANLVTALRRPEVRGRWGEVTLQRVVEIAGMTKHVDYAEQESQSTESGRLRPDMIVRLPNDRVIVIDAKTPASAYLDAIEAPTPEEHKSCLERHAQQVRARVSELSKKGYTDGIEGSPEFIVMFMPSESFLQAAFAADPRLIEDALKASVLITSPVSLMGVLNCVARGWREHQLAEGAEEVRRLGQEIHERLGPFMKHMQALRQHLVRVVGSYGDAVGSLESKVLPSARRFRELGAASGDELPELEPIDAHPRELTAPEATDDDA